MFILFTKFIILIFYGSFLLFMLKLCFSCCLVCSSQPCGHMLEKGWPLGLLVWEVILCFCQFPMWCPGSSVVLDCIDN